MKTCVFSIGGSILCPDGPSTDFIDKLCAVLREVLAGDTRIALIVGGGSIAREFQKVLRVLHPNCSSVGLDYVGIEATRLNANLLAANLGLSLPVPRSPEALVKSGGRCMVMGGWKPGFSTDMVALCVAELLGVPMLCNLTNVDKVYDKDPRKHPDAKAFGTMNWNEYCTLFSLDAWEPGMNAPFDPVAAQRARDLSMKVCIANAQDPGIIKNIVDGNINNDTVGTVISN